MSYEIEIIALGRGEFIATYQGMSVVGHDPEHDICNRIANLGYEDGPVQFIRDGVPTLSHSSLHKMGRRRIEMGQRFPYQRPKRRLFDLSRRAKIAGGVTYVSGDDSP